MELVYLAGPYRSNLGTYGVHRNIEGARAVARQLWLRGYAVLCPHTNTGYMDGSDIQDSVFLNGDIEMLRRCDSVVVLPGWEQSSGTQVEIQYASAHGIPVTYWKADS